MQLPILISSTDHSLMTAAVLFLSLNAIQKKNGCGYIEERRGEGFFV